MILALGIGSTAFAQNRTLPAVVPAPKMKKQESRIDNGAPSGLQGNHSTVTPTATNGNQRVITRTKLGSSPNLLSVLVGESHALTYNKDINMVGMAHRKTQSLTGTSGYINMSYSLNQGATWDSTFLVYTTGAPNNGRYPTGGIYNPWMNTNPMGAYAVVAGPITDGAGWQGNYFASRQFDLTNQDQDIKLNSDPGATFQHMARVASSAHSNGKAYVLASDYDYNSTATVIPYNGAVLNIGTFNTGTEGFDWSTQRIYQPFAHDPNDDSQLFYAFANMAFNEAGDIGYIVFMGIDSVNNYGVNQPILYKTTDAGATWTKMPVMDFSTVAALTDSLIPSDNGTGPSIPFWSANQGWDVIVDGFDNPHIVSVVYSVATASPSDPAQTQIYASMDLFDVFIDQYGNWNAHNFGTIMTDDVPAASSPWTTSGGMGWDARIQASKSDDGKVLFYSWLDTDPTLATENLFPDIWAASLDITNYNAILHAPAMNFTSSSSYASDNYWMYTAQNVFEAGAAGAMTFTIPTTVSDSWNPSDDGSGPVEHYFVSGVSFTQPVDYIAIPLGNKDMSTASFAVSQNYPNPFNGTTMINVSLPVSTDLNITVVDLMGKTVLTKTTNNAAAGAHTISINSNELSSGVYFYTVTAGGEKVTRKMIIE